MKTAITEMFGIKYPIICGAMMWICKSNFARPYLTPVYGNLTAGNYSTEDEFRDAIRQTRKLTDKPFMVNVTILPSVHITAEHHKMYCVSALRKGLRSGNIGALDKVAENS